MAKSIISFSNITKKFPGVVALNKISFEIEQGEILALCGENGAGKSTLINLCGGAYLPDDGFIEYKGVQVIINSPSKSEKLGIATVYQEIPICPNLTVAENMFMSRKPQSKYGLLDRKIMRIKTAEILELFRIKRNPDELMEKLTLAEQSFVQIAKAIYHEPELLILDEPTSSLSEEQKDLLFDSLKAIKKERTLTILYVSHRMAEIFQISDRIAVLRDGYYMGTVRAREISHDDIIQLMVGRDIKTDYLKSGRVGERILEVKRLSGGKILRNINFSLYKGEILGFAGFQGAGRTEMAKAIFGLDKRVICEITFEGKSVRIRNPKDAIRLGIGMIPENRKDEGIITFMSLKENMVMILLKTVAVCGILVKKRIRQIFRKYADVLRIKYVNADQSIGGLSGGNQQKVIIARWLAKSPKVLICDEPTRGIDVGAKAEIHNILCDLAREGVAIMLISSELPELLGISDRIIVMHEGKITGELAEKEMSEQKIMRLAAAI